MIDFENNFNEINGTEKKKCLKFFIFFGRDALQMKIENIKKKENTKTNKEENFFIIYNTIADIKSF